jgi:hypothetical protein
MCRVQEQEQDDCPYVREEEGWRVFKRGRPDGQEVARQTRARRLDSSNGNVHLIVLGNTGGARSAQESQSEIAMACSAAMETTEAVAAPLQAYRGALKGAVLRLAGGKKLQLNTRWETSEGAAQHRWTWHEPLKPLKPLATELKAKHDLKHTWQGYIHVQSGTAITAEMLCIQMWLFFTKGHAMTPHMRPSRRGHDAHAAQGHNTTRYINHKTHTGGA